MKTSSHRLFLSLSLVLTVLSFSSAALLANLLVDPGFENNPLATYVNVLTNFPLYQGQWGPENAAITGFDAGVTPIQGVKMLRMMDDGLIATQVFQVTDVTSYAAVTDSGGAIFSLSAMLNAGDRVTAGAGGVTLLFFSASNFGSQIGTPAIGNIILDNNPNTWQVASVGGILPVGTRWVLTQVAFTNATMNGYPGYVDETDLRIVPEPFTMALLGLGSLFALRRRA